MYKYYSFAIYVDEKIFKNVRKIKSVLIVISKYFVLR